MRPKNKTVAANEKAIDELPLDSGTWCVQGQPGLYVRCRATSKAYLFKRRINKEIVKRSLGEIALKDAKALALTLGATRKRVPVGDTPTLGAAIEQYLTSRALAPKTVVIARYNTNRYLSHWRERTLDEIGRDRASVRLLQETLTRKHKRSTSNQVVRLLSAVYRWHRKVLTDLPESPFVVCEIHKIRARDWAYSPDELRSWWRSRKEEKDGTVTDLGVSTLGPLKKMWWLTALLTGARKGSVEAMQWAHVDFQKKTIHFRETKGDHPYFISMSDLLAELLAAYRDRGDAPPSPWVFPSPTITGAHLIDVKNPNEGVGPAHRLRHSFGTTLAELGATPDQSKMLMGHSLGGDVSRGYITSSLVLESLRPVANAVAAHYMGILGLTCSADFVAVPAIKLVHGRRSPRTRGQTRTSKARRGERS